MKRKLIAFFLILSLLVPLTVSAENILVIDNADLLTSAEEAQLEDIARALQDTYAMDVVILTIDSLEGAGARKYAEDYYDGNGYGDDGVLFLLAMEEREWYISTCGSAMYAVADQDVDSISDLVVPYLSEGDYVTGFESFLASLGTYFYVYQKSHDYTFSPDQASRPEIPIPRVINWPIALLAGLIAAGVTILVMVSSMNTKRRQHSAADYLKAGSYHLRVQRDLFLYSHTSKVRRQQNTTSSGGRRSGGRSSGGRSHGGRGGRF